MIYSNFEEYTILFYRNSQTNEMPARKFIESLDLKVRLKIEKYFKMLQLRQGYLDEPYARHIQGKIRELRVDFAVIRHRIFYFTFVDKKIIILHGFIKKVQKTPPKEIQIALERYNDVIHNPQLYEKNVNK
jgi:phage-related protein